MGWPARIRHSHCSSQLGTTDGTKQYQDTLAPNDSSIGYEVADSSWDSSFPPHCPPGILHCSNADAAVYRSTLGPGGWYFQRIARPVSGCFPSCTPPVLTIDPDYRKFWSIVRTDTLISEGDLVSKIGSFTGWTQSYVRIACMDVQRNGVTYFCQAYSDFGIEDGDSGAPVLEDILGGTDTTVTLGGSVWGIVVGGDRDGWGVFSPWSQILKNYPGLRVHN